MVAVVVEVGNVESEVGEANHVDNGHQNGLLNQSSIGNEPDWKQ